MLACWLCENQSRCEVHDAEDFQYFEEEEKMTEENWCIIRTNDNTMHRGPFTESVAREWIAEWLEDGGRGSAFVLARISYDIVKEDKPDLRGWPAYTTQLNDLVGGYIVTTFPYPASAHDHSNDGDPMKCGYNIADCMTKEDAIVIANNLNLILYVPTLKDPARWRWVTVGYLEGSLRPSPYK